TPVSPLSTLFPYTTLFRSFSKFIGALEPWLCEVVLIGGWAHRLYRRHPLARRLAYLPLITLDGDVAVPPKLKARELSVRKRLLDAGFVEEFVGEDWPPATPVASKIGWMVIN